MRKKSIAFLIMVIVFVGGAARADNTVVLEHQAQQSFASPDALNQYIQSNSNEVFSATGPGQLSATRVIPAIDYTNYVNNFASLDQLVNGVVVEFNS